LDVEVGASLEVGGTDFAELVSDALLLLPVTARFAAEEPAGTAEARVVLRGVPTPGVPFPRLYAVDAALAFDVAFRSTPAVSAMASPTYKTAHGGAPRTPRGWQEYGT
jgi:hypothetical protein